MTKSVVRARRKRPSQNKVTQKQHGILEALARRIYFRRFPDTENLGDSDNPRSDIERLVAVHQNRRF